MVVNELYYGQSEINQTESVQRGFAASAESESLAIDDDVIAAALHNIYHDFNPRTEIEPNLFNAIAHTLGEAVSTAAPSLGDDPLIHALRHSTDVFSAFKVHRAQNDMAARLVDSNGNLKPFEQWKNEVMPIASHQCGSWLETEYNTAVIRARQAAQWEQFEREKDVLPNLKWQPSTSPNPGKDHQPFWNTILPINHSFWDAHRPGDRWNCKCSLTSTDEPPTSVPSSSPAGNNPQPGLKDNPGKTQSVFSNDHPYFPSDCKHCAFYKPTLKARLSTVITARAKDCYHCPYINGCINKIDGWEDDTTYGKRLQTHERADQNELAGNIRAAKSLLSSFSDMTIKIREHVLIHGVPNPEYEINGLIGDRKGIMAPQGVTSAFKKAIKQGCQTVVIDLDMHLKERNLAVGALAKFIDWRKIDFETGTIRECYVIYRGKAIRIDNAHIGREAIIAELKKLKQ